MKSCYNYLSGTKLIFREIKCFKQYFSSGKVSYKLYLIFGKMWQKLLVSFSDDEFVIGPCRSTATHDKDRK
jgi:hypothetical protein